MDRLHTVFFILISLLLIFGISALVLGAVAKQLDDENDWYFTWDPPVTVMGKCTIAIGFFLTLGSLFGTYAGITNSHQNLVLFIVWVNLLLPCQIVGAFFCVLNSNGNESRRLLTDRIGTLFLDPKWREMDSDAFQQEFDCCGIEGPRFWGNIVPESCYSKGRRTQEETGLSETGCAQAFIAESFKYLKATAGLLGGFSVLNISIAICAYLIIQAVLEEEN